MGVVLVDRGRGRCLKCMDYKASECICMMCLHIDKSIVKIREGEGADREEVGGLEPGTGVSSERWLFSDTEEVKGVLSREPECKEGICIVSFGGVIQLLVLPDLGVISV